MKVFIGPSNSGKTGQVIALVARAIKEGSRARLVVPSASAASVIEARLAQVLRDLKINSPKQSIITFPGLYTLLLNEAGKNPTVLHTVERERIMRAVISDLSGAGSLSYFDKIADRPGLAAAVAGFIDELWRSGAGPDRFARFARHASKKDEDIARIYESYPAALKSIGAIDAEGAGLLALASVSESISISLVAADGFDFYTPVQIAILKSLSARGVEVAATLTYETGRAVHLWHAPTFERLKESGAEIIRCATSQTGVISRAASVLLNDDAARLRTDDETNDAAIKIISAPDRAAEVRAVAREIKRLVIEGGFSVSEMTVVCRSLSTYSFYLERIFDECSIPLALDCTRPLAESPFVVALMHLLSLSAKQFPRRALVDSLRSPYFSLSSFGLDADAIDRLDRISVERNVTRGREQWLRAVEDWFAEVDRRSSASDDEIEIKPDERRERYTSLRNGLNSFFDDATPRPLATRAAHAGWLNGLLERLRVGDLTGDDRAFETLSAQIKIIAADKHRIRDRIAEGGSQGYESEITWLQFYNELERAVAGASFDRAANITPAVVCQEVHHIRPAIYRAVFVLGLIEGEFPAKAAEGAPYTIRERDQLRAAGFDLTELPTDAGADLSQFYKAMSKTADKLYLSYARTDLAGGELLPSYLIEEVKAVAATEEIRIGRAAFDDLKLQEMSPVSLEELARLTAQTLGARENLQGDAHELLKRELPSWAATIRGARVERMRIRQSRGNYGGQISSGDLLDGLSQSFGDDHHWSASQINDYGACPFRFFAKHVLRLSPASEPTEGFASNQLGHAYHEILERLYSKLKRGDTQLNSETIHKVAEQAAEIAEEVLEKKLEKGEIRKSALWDFEKEEIKKRVAWLLQKEAEWNSERPARPTHFERSFGFGHQPPLVIKSSDVQVRIRGVIDRIDECDDGCIVIDYKTGRTPISHRDALDGRNLQLPIYVMAASRVVNPGTKVASAYYLHINSRKKGSELPRKGVDLSLDELISFAEGRIVEYVRRARAGLFPVAPNSGRCYQGCEFDVVCRIQSVGLRAEEEYE